MEEAAYGERIQSRLPWAMIVCPNMIAESVGLGKEEAKQAAELSC